MSQPSLFDQHDPTKCRACGAQLQPGRTRTMDCRVDRDRSMLGDPVHRPKQCLNRYDPATAPMPEDY